MGWLSILGIAVALAMDAFAVSIAAGVTVRRITNRHVFRIAFHFGLFQFLMPIVGWLAGSAVAEHIQAFDHWIAFGLLGLVGGKMLLDAARSGKDSHGTPRDPTRGLTMVALSIATSIDALAVGVSLAILGVSIWAPSVVIGAVAGVLSMIGIRFGARIGPRLRRWADALGGVVLIGIGTRILVLHLQG